MSLRAAMSAPAGGWVFDGDARKSNIDIVIHAASGAISAQFRRRYWRHLPAT